MSISKGLVLPQNSLSSRIVYDRKPFDSPKFLKFSFFSLSQLGLSRLDLFPFFGRGLLYYKMAASADVMVAIVVDMVRYAKAFSSYLLW